MTARGCVVCGKPVSPKDGVEDRCGHHRRQFLRNQAKSAGLPPPTKQRPPPKRQLLPQGESPLLALTPASLKAAHARGDHEQVPNIACILCIRALGGRVDHVEMKTIPPERSVRE